jgi:hypothetical protein
MRRPHQDLRGSKLDITPANNTLFSLLAPVQCTSNQLGPLHLPFPSFLSLQFRNLASTSGVICRFMELAAMTKASDGTCGKSNGSEASRTTTSKARSTYMRSLHILLHSQQCCLMLTALEKSCAIVLTNGCTHSAN